MKNFILDIFDSPAAFLLTIVLGILLLIAVLVAVVNRAKVPGELAQIEQLRQDVQRVDANKAEDVVGQVTQWNQRIASSKAYNQLWYSSWAVPDAWDTVEPIEIPR